MNSFRLVFTFFVLFVSAAAQVTTTGFLNQPRAEAPGTLLSHPITNGSEPIGRTTSINYLNGWIIVGGESPGSRPGSDLIMRVYDISDPTNLIRRLPSDFGLSYSNNLWIQDSYGWNAHGTAQYGNLVLPVPIRVNGFGGLVELSGTNGVPLITQLPILYNRSSQAGPWQSTLLWYDTPDSDMTITRQSIGGNGLVSGRLMATFDHVGAFGGGDWHPMFFGDLLIYARSGLAGNDGVVVYRLAYNNMDDADPNNDSVTPHYVGSLTGGFQAYWPNLFSDGTGLYVIGSTTDILMAADITQTAHPAGSGAVQTVATMTVPFFSNATYPVYQDNFAFIHNRKIDMTRFIAGDANPITLTLNESNPPRQPGAPALPNGALVGVNTSQMSLPLGNLWLTGGYPITNFNQGLGVWVHQQVPDTSPPRVSYHIPQAGRTNYPRHAPLSFLVHEHPRNGGPRNGIDFTVRPVEAGDTLGSFVPGFLIHDFSGNMTFTPNEPLAANTTYQVNFLSDPAQQIGFRDAAGNYIEPYSFRFSTGGGINATPPPAFTSFTADNYQPAPNTQITVTGNASGTAQLEYRFNFDGNWTAWSTSPSASFTYITASRPRVLAQVRDPLGGIAASSLSLLVITPPPSSPRPTQSSTLAIGDDPGGRRVWSVNPDADTVTVLDATTGAKVAEHAVGVNPRSIARDGSGRYWVTCHRSDEIRILNTDGTPFTTISTGYGSAPYGIAPSPNGTLMYVTLFGAGRVQRYAVANPGAAPLSYSGVSTARAIAISADGARVFVTRFISSDGQGEIGEFNATLGFTRLITLSMAYTADSGDRAAGVPNYLAGIAISPDGTRAAVVSKQDNTFRGTGFGVGNLTHETTNRAVISFLNLTTNAEIRHTRRDFDNSDSPTAVAYTPLGDTLLVTLQGNNTLVGLDALSIDQVSTAITPGSTLTSPAIRSLEVSTGLAPQGLVVDATTNRIYIQNFMGRSVSVRNAQPLLVENRTTLPLIATTNCVSTELLTAPVLLGKQIFYNAADPRMSADSYISCATCHVDGGHDGRVWDFTGRSEGLRRTTDLRGRSGMGHGAVHWSGNFDEIQDFEHDMRGAFGGTGFINLTPQQFATQHPSPASGKTGLSADLDALAAYVSSLTPEHTPRSPNRNTNGTLTAAAVAGQAVFTAQNCASCHSGTSFTNNTLMNVGTQSALSGSRLGQTLTGIDTPTLHGLHATRLYLHHGQAATLSDVFSSAGGRLTYGSTGTYTGPAATTSDNALEGGGGTARGYFGGTAAFLNTGGTSSVRFSNIDGGSGGTGRIAFRYVRQYNSGTSSLIINGVSQTITTLQQTPDTGFNTSGWRWFTIDAALNAGASNSIEIQRNDNGGPIQVNVLLVANADVLAQAQPHRVVQSLSTTDRSNLLAYLNQLDGRDANGTPLAAPIPPAPQAPSIVSQPGATTAVVNTSVNFVIIAAGTGPFTYEWRRGSTVVGTNSAEFPINSVQYADAATYSCTITSALGSVVSQPIALTVTPPLEITSTTLPASRLEQSYSHAVAAIGGAGTRTWSVVSGLLPPGITLSSNGVLSGTPTVSGRAAITMQVSDSSGSDTQAFTLDAIPVGGFVNDPDLILHYTFDEGGGTQVWDSAPTGNNHATTVPNAQWIGSGRFGGAWGPASTAGAMASFFPTNQTDLNFLPRGDPFTISVWVRTTFTAGGYRTIFGKDEPVVSGYIQNRLWATNTMSTVQGGHGGQGSAQISTSPTLNNGQWHLLTLTNQNVSGTWVTRIYYDDGMLLTQFNTGPGTTASGLLRIGDTSLGGNGWNGQIDDFRIYRRALSVAEISALYTAPQTETYGGWSAANLPANPGLNGSGHDANGNGIPNLIEFIASQPLSLHFSGGNATLTLSRNSAARGVTLIIECSDDLAIWTPLATSINGAPPTGTATISEGSGVVRTLTVQHAASPNRSFYRVRAVMP
ncbi:MAG: LamG-like jellyroll fold domain-containing protein [Prosthecobacter sp.]